MDVQTEKHLANNHRIQIGTASWDSSQRSVRSAYYRDNGGFNYAGSAEVSVSDLLEMVKMSVEEGHLTEEEVGVLKLSIGGSLV